MRLAATPATLSRAAQTLLQDTLSLDAVFAAAKDEVPVEIANETLRAFINRPLLEHAASCARFVAQHYATMPEDLQQVRSLASSCEGETSAQQSCTVGGAARAAQLRLPAA